MDKIVLTEEKETPLIPLFAKAEETKKETPILVDNKAVEIVNQIDYDFRSLNIPEKTNIMMCLRAKLIDNYVRDLLAKSDENVALHLGCGLDGRYDRIKAKNVDWYDIDFKEVIDVRKNFFEETERYHMISSSVTGEGWLELIPKVPGQYIVVAEGLFMYLKEEEIKKLLNNLKDSIGSYALIFDAYSVLAARNAKNHPSIKKTGATIHWGIDDPGELTTWGTDIRFIEEQYFTANRELEKLAAVTRLLFKAANLFPVAKRAHRLLVYHVG